jgi:hypothetical protein
VCGLCVDKEVMCKCSLKLHCGRTCFYIDMGSSRKARRNAYLIAAYSVNDLMTH